MNIEEVREYALSLPGTTEDQAYGEDWVLFRIEGKIFLHIWLNAPEPSCALKLPPEQGQALRGMLNNHKVVICNKLILNNSYLQVSILLLSALLQGIETVTIFAPANKKLVNVKADYYERD